MNRASALSGALLLVLGLSLFLWKAFALDLPLMPSNPEGLWRVELEITARGDGGRGSLRAPLPTTGEGQIIFDEETAADRLRLSEREDGEQRVAVWRGRFSGVHQVVHAFRVQLSEVTIPLPSGPTARPPAEVVERWARPDADLPADAPEVEELLAMLRLPPSDDRVGQVRLLFGFVSDETSSVPTGTDDALLTLAGREGSAKGQTQLLVALLRAAGIPARPVLGLWLRADATPEEVCWAEAWIDGRWVPMSPSDGFFARRPIDRLQLQVGSLESVRGTDVDAVGHRFRALRERLRPDELATMMLPTNPMLATVSLYKLPVGTQKLLRAILLLPLGALLIAVFRNLVGVPTFGTFMPILIAFAMRETSLGLGLFLVGCVIALGIAGRLVLERLRLLLVPRLGVLLCLVVLAVTAFSVLGEARHQRDLTNAVLFPLVILTMLIERFSVTLAEEGFRTALVRAAWSTAVAVVVYPIFRSADAEHLMFGFPELVVAVMGALVWIGGYTGYRVSDLLRFRTLAQQQGGATP